MVTCLRILERGGDLDRPAGVAALAGRLVDRRHAIFHLEEVELREIPSVLAECVALLEALGLSEGATRLDRRKLMLEQQIAGFPFPGLPRGGRPRTLFVAPCSAHKRKFAEPSMAEPGPHDVLSELRRAGATEVADDLERERSRPAVRAGLDVDASGLLPAYERYAEGTLWKAGVDRRPGLRRAVEAGVDLCLISGAYGLVHAREPIGYYDIELSDAGWKPEVIGRALAEYASALEAHRVVALLRVPEYQRIVSNAKWSQPVKTVDILSPEGLEGPVSSDASLGEALEVLLSGDELPPAWVSSDAAMLMRRRVRP